MRLDYHPVALSGVIRRPSTWLGRSNKKKKSVRLFIRTLPLIKCLGLLDLRVKIEHHLQGHAAFSMAMGAGHSDHIRLGLHFKLNDHSRKSQFPDPHTGPNGLMVWHGLPELLHYQVKGLF